MLREKFALTERGAFEFKRGALFCAVANLVMMAPIGIICMAAGDFLAHLVDPDAPLPNLGFYAVNIAVVLALMLATQWLEYEFTYNSVYAESARKRIELAEVLRELPLSFFGRKEISDLTTTLMKDCSDQERMFSHIVPLLCGTAVSTAIVSAVLFVLDWRLALSALWVLPVALGIVLGSARRQRRANERLAGEQLRLAGDIQEYLERAQEIRAGNKTDSFVSRLDERIDEAERTQVSNELATAVPVSAAQALLRLGMASTVVVGTVLLANGQVGFMIYFCFLLAATRIYDPISTVLEVIAELLSLRVGIRRMKSIEGQPRQEGERKFSPESFDIAFKNVSFSYERGGDVLSGVSFVAKEGEVTALVGPSGGGKSTVVWLAARFWDADEGVVSLGGTDVSTIDPEALLTYYAQVFQDVVLFDDTIMENIRFGKPGATDEEVLAAAREANCDEFVLRMKDGYRTRIGENGSRLSGGERQRVSIARALLKDAPIVLLDEATASLDVESETKIQEALSRLLVGKTVLVIAHRMRTVLNADKVIVLDAGKVVEEGSPRDLLASGGAFRRMVDVQQSGLAWTIGQQVR